MNSKYRAKDCKRLAGALAQPLAQSLALALVVWLTPIGAPADDGNLYQELRIQQQKSSFQLKLEQVQEQARRRAAAAQTARAAQTESAAGLDIGDPDQSMRLAPRHVTEPLAPRIDADEVWRIQAQQSYERDQQRILDYRQQRSALTAGARAGGDYRYAAKRSELVRFNTQNQRQTLQRKLRR